MSSSRRPWYPWYPKDFTADEKVQCLPALAELVYRRALDLMWQSNDIRIPNAMPLLWQSLGRGIAENDFAIAWERIQYPDFELFRVSEDGKWLFSDRLKREADKIVEQYEVKQAAGIKGAKARWSGKRMASAKQPHSSRIANAKQADSYTDTHTHTNIKEKKKNIKKKKSTPKKFIPPALDDVKSYFRENGFSEESAETFHKYYSNGEPPWHDGHGNPVKSWKQKAVAVWFKPENQHVEGKQPWHV